MKKYMYMSFIVALLCSISLCFTACGDDDEKDMTRPSITDTGITANPINCQIYHRGEEIPVRYVFTDNVELGKFNIEIHGNFDHHTHSTEAVECEEEEHEHEEGTPSNPWVYNHDYDIPTGLQTYTTDINILIPTDIATGHYHFMIRVTDQAGWQEIKSVAIEIEE